MLQPTRIHLLFHSWALPSIDTGVLRRETVQLLSEYLGWHYPGSKLLVSFDEQMIREIEIHMDWDYEGLLPSERDGASILSKKELSGLVGDVMRFFVARDSFTRMRLSREQRNADHGRYGLGEGRDTVPYPPYREAHMPRFPLTFDKTYDGSQPYEGSILPGENPAFSAVE